MVSDHRNCDMVDVYLIISTLNHSTFFEVDLCEIFAP